MMNKKYKILGVSAITALMLALNGCGGVGDNNVGDTYADVWEYKISMLEDTFIDVDLITHRKIYDNNTSSSATTTNDTAVGGLDGTEDNSTLGGEDGTSAISKSYNILEYPSHGSLEMVDNTIVRYTPDDDYNQTDSFKVSYSSLDDPNYAEFLYKITIQDVEEGNTPPTISGKPTTEITEGQEYHFKPKASDEDGDTLSFVISNAPAWMELNNTTGELSGKADKTPSEFHDITLIVSDGDVDVELEPFDLKVLSLDEE